jgi:outer membrane lipoprotein carrier protein
MTNRTHRTLSRLPLAALAAALLAVGSAQAGARDDLDAFTHGLKGLQGQFTQQVFDANGKRKENSSGNVALSAPRLFRWEYAKPYPQLIVADGDFVWIYEPDLQQATKRPQGAEEQNSPLAALIDPTNLDRQFNVSEAGTEAGLEWLQLTPLSDEDGGFRDARLGFGKAGLVRMTVVDALGQRTEIVFSDWKRNPSFAKGTFRFVPGKDVDVVGGG